MIELSNHDHPNFLLLSRQYSGFGVLYIVYPCLNGMWFPRVCKVKLDCSTQFLTFSGRDSLNLQTK